MGIRHRIASHHIAHRFGLTLRQSGRSQDPTRICILIKCSKSRKWLYRIFVTLYLHIMILDISDRVASIPTRVCF